MLRYAAVRYLNTRPLLDGLADEVGEPVRLELPAALPGLLRRGEVDVALAPVVAAFEDPSLVIVPAGAIATHGHVGSVLLFSRVDPREARVVGLDTSSRTSVALTRALFRFRWEASPEFVDRAPDPDLRHMREDAALLIGDPALRAVWDGPPPIDLGAEWVGWTGLPFVFAAWLARDASVAAAAAPALARAAARGRTNLAAIAAAGAVDLGISTAAAQDYLDRRLSFDFGDAERRGLERFRQLWSRLSA